MRALKIKLYARAWHLKYNAWYKQCASLVRINEQRGLKLKQQKSKK